MPNDQQPWPDSEPADVDATSPDPGVNVPPPHGSHPASDALPSDSVAAPEEPEEIPEFDPKHREPFEGLLYIGRLTKEFVWLGHRFVIRTLSDAEILEVGLLHRQYANTLSDIKAYQTAVVAACVQKVDGKSLPYPISDEPDDTMLTNRFRYIADHWYPPTLDAVYEQYLVLESEVGQVIEAMGKASG